MIWIAKHRRVNSQMLGFIPRFLSNDDTRPARVQINENYKHGGGWRPFQGFVMLSDNMITYPGDPPYLLLYESVLHGDHPHLKTEIIRFYQHEWLAIIQEDGSYEIARID